MAATSGDVVHLLRDCPQCEQRFQPCDGSGSCGDDCRRDPTDRCCRLSRWRCLVQPQGSDAITLGIREYRLLLPVGPRRTAIADRPNVRGGGEVSCPADGQEARAELPPNRSCSTLEGGNRYSTLVSYLPILLVSLPVCGESKPQLGHPAGQDIPAPLCRSAVALQFDPAQNPYRAGGSATD
jgi:hypothetical protein